MISTAKRLFKHDGYNVGIASVFDDDGRAFLQVALLFGKENPVSTLSHFIPMDTTRDTEELMRNMVQADIPALVDQVRAEIPLVDILTKALNTAKANPTVYHAPVVAPTQKKAYKRTIR